MELQEEIWIVWFRPVMMAELQELPWMVLLLPPVMVQFLAEVDLMLLK